MPGNLEVLFTKLKTIAPTAHLAFRASQYAPYIIYYFETDRNFYADNNSYVKKKSGTIEIYLKKFDQALLDKLENALESLDNFTFSLQQETYLNDENLYLISYEFELIEGVR
jgi:hypothetical protein